MIESTTIRSQSFLNGGFENNTVTGSCNINLLNGTFNSFIYDVFAYGTGNEMDILKQGGCLISSVQEGAYCVALSKIGNIKNDEIILKISNLLLPGNYYSFTFWAYLDTVNSTGKNTNLEIGLSQFNNSFGNLIATTIPIVPTIWNKYTVTFIAPTNGQYISIRNGVTNYDSNWVIVDDFSFTKSPIDLNLGSDTSLCVGDTLAISAVNLNATYLWQDNNTTSPTYKVYESGKYWVSVFNDLGVAVDTINVNFKNCSEPSLVIPNVFTPNGDSTNDNFEFEVFNVEFLVFNIYDRWGLPIKNLELNTKNYINWDGRTTSGTECSDGVYYYTLNYKLPNGDTATKKGFITLIR